MQKLPAPGGTVAAAAEEAGQTEQIAEVALKQRNQKHKRRSETLPQAEPEAANSVVFIGRSFALGDWGGVKITQ